MRNLDGQQSYIPEVLAHASLVARKAISILLVPPELHSGSKYVFSDRLHTGIGYSPYFALKTPLQVPIYTVDAADFFNREIWAVMNGHPKRVNADTVSPG